MPVHRHIMAVAVHTSRVSIKTDSICTRPCLTGWDTSAAAAALGAEPTPASLEYSPRLMPSISAEPAKPPKMARKSKAPAMILLNTWGSIWKFSAMTTSAIRM